MTPRGNGNGTLSIPQRTPMAIWRRRRGIKFPISDDNAHDNVPAMGYGGYGNSTCL